MFALFYETGLLNHKDYSLRIGNVEEIRDQLAYTNDWMCLVEMGRSMGPKSDQPKLTKLENFLCTCEDRETLEKFKLKISTGELGCIMCTETEEELERMRKFVLSAPDIDKKYHDKINGLFDRLIEYLQSGESGHTFYSKVSQRQYINTGIARDDYID